MVPVDAAHEEGADPHDQSQGLAPRPVADAALEVPAGEETRPELLGAPGGVEVGALSPGLAEGVEEPPGRLATSHGPGPQTRDERPGALDGAVDHGADPGITGRRPAKFAVRVGCAIGLRRFHRLDTWRG